METVNCPECGRSFSAGSRKFPRHNTRASAAFGTKWVVSSEKCGGSGADVLPMLIKNAEWALESAEKHIAILQENIARENERLSGAKDRESRCRETLAKLKEREKKPTTGAQKEDE